MKSRSTQILALQEEIGKLKERQDVHLRLIDMLTRKEPYEDELEDLRRMVATLIAEVGTLRSRLRLMAAEVGKLRPASKKMPSLDLK